MGDLRSFHGGRVFELAKKEGIDPKSFIDFSANISPFPIDEKIRQRIYSSIDELMFYPETQYGYIYKKLAGLHKINKNSIRLGNGAIDIIYKLANFFSILSLKNPKKTKVLIVEPSFSEYSKAFKTYENIDLLFYDMDEENLRLDEHIINILNEDILAVFVCNPNNPSSTLVDKNILDKMLKICKEKNIYLVLDECFMDFISNEEKFTCLYNIKDNKKLIILRSFTKLFSIAGLRFGYVLSSNEEVLNSLDKLSPQWNINTPALRAATEACSLYEHIKTKNINFIEKERLYLVEELKKFDIKIYKSEANFILFRANNKYEDLENYLFKKRILIRSCSNYRKLDKRYYRIAIREHKDNVKLIESLKEYFL